MNDDTIKVEGITCRPKYKTLLPGGRVVVADFELAKEFGLETAVILQQLHFLLRNKKNGKILKGRKGRWIYNTYEEWRKQHFPWMSLMSIRRRFRELEVGKLVESCQPEGRFSRRKYYRLSDIMIKMTADSLRSIRADNKRILNAMKKGK